MENYSVEFEQRVYEKQPFNEVVDRSFKEFGVTPTASLPTVEEFFRTYEDLYFVIPASGSTNSHQYLIEKSSELYKLPETLVDIQPLLDEITVLKNQVIQDQQTIADLQLQIASSSI